MGGGIEVEAAVPDPGAELELLRVRTVGAGPVV